jgi:hypothetical protein
VNAGKTNPIEPNFLMPDKMNTTTAPTKPYKDENPFRLNKYKPNRTQLQKQKTAAEFSSRLVRLE